MKIFQRNQQYNAYNMYGLEKYMNRKFIMNKIIIIFMILIVLLFILFFILNKNNKNWIDFSKIKQCNIDDNIEIDKGKFNLTNIGVENLNKIYSSEIKRVFLTFDDGPSQNTGDILDILKEKNIKATFFVLGSQVEKMPETTKRIYEEGHYIANHGYSHVYSKIYKSPEDVLDEYNKCNQIVANVLEIPEFNSHLFRFPGGATGGKYSEIKDKARELLHENNILYVDWNSLTGDSEKNNPTQKYLMDNLKRTSNGKNSVVLLMHDSQSKRETVDFLHTVIDYFDKQEYKFEDFYSIIQ